MRVEDWLVALLGSLIFFVLPSDVLHSAVNLTANQVFAITLPICIALSLIVGRGRVSKMTLLICGAIILISCVATAVAGRYTQLLIGFAFAGSCVFISAGYERLVGYRSLFFINVFAWILLSGAVIGLIYSMSGGGPMLELRIADRTTFLFLTTFAEDSGGGFIRPTAIYNEPGALAMVVTVILVLNHEMGVFKKSSIALAIALIFVGSLAGAIVSALYFLTSRLLSPAWKGALIIFLVAAISAVFVLRDSGNAIVDFLDDMYLERLRVEDGWLVGDNRTGQVMVFLDRVDEEIILQGGAFSGAFSDVDVSSNPFSMIASHGVFISLPYFFALVWLGLLMLRGKSSNLFGPAAILLTLLQRPYLLYFPWSAMILLAMFSVTDTRHYISIIKSHR